MSYAKIKRRQLEKSFCEGMSMESLAQAKQLGITALDIVKELSTLPAGGSLDAPNSASQAISDAEEHRQGG